MLSENELNNVIGEFYFNHYNNSGTEDITYNQLKDNRASGIGFNQLANNGNNGDADGFDELVNNNDNSDIKAIDFNQSYSNHGNLFDEASQSLSQEFNKSFLKIIEGEKVDLENSIKGDLKRIEQIRMEVINKQNKINELKGLIDRVKQNKIDKPNGKVRVVRQNKSAAQNGKVLPSFSNQTVSKRPTIERKILLMEDYMKRTSTIKELCERYKISKQTFYRIKEDYESFKGGLNVEKVEVRGRNSKLNKDQRGALYYEITTQPKRTTTVRGLTKLINQRFDLNVSLNTYHKALQKAENGWKTEARIPDSWNEPKILELRKKFVQCLPSYGKGKTEFYLGECTFNLEENVGYSWALKGRNETLANRKRQKPLHLIIAINKIGDVIKMYLNKNKNGLEEIADDTKMKQFFNENITDLKNSAIYLDNLSFHMYAQNNEEFSNMLEMNNVSFIHYPPCSIFMNPIEYFVNEIYKYIKDQAFKTREQLIYLIENGIVRNTEQEKIQLFINRANLFNQSCLNNESINGFILPDNQLKSI